MLAKYADDIGVTMNQTSSFSAIDIGASSGRVMLGRCDGQRFDLRELHRFLNMPLEAGGSLHWNVQQLWQDIKTCLRRYAEQYADPLAGIGIDTWAVDYGLLDADGHLLG